LQKLDVQMGIHRTVITDRADLLTPHDVRTGRYSLVDAVEMQVDEIHQSVIGIIDLKDDMTRTVSILILFIGEAYLSPAHSVNLRPFFGREVNAIVEIPPVGVDARSE